MAYKPMNTKVTNGPVTAADWNQIGDNFAAGVPGAMTTKGDIIIATGDDGSERLGVGVNDSLYWADSAASGGISTSVPARLSAKPSGSFTYLTRNAWTSIPTFTAEDFDTAGAFASLQFVTPHSGYYLAGLGFGIDLAGGSGGTSAPYSLQVGLYKNGALFTVLGFIDLTDMPAITGYLMQVYGCDIVKLVKGDIIQPVYYVNHTKIDIRSDVTATRTKFYLAPLI